MSAIPTGRDPGLRSTCLLLASFARQILWTDVGALAARPLPVAMRPLPIRTRRISRRTTNGLRDGA